jgi:hypothetical protein
VKISTLLPMDNILIGAHQQRVEADGNTTMWVSFALSTDMTIIGEVNILKNYFSENISDF